MAQLLVLKCDAVAAKPVGVEVGELIIIRGGGGGGGRGRRCGPGHAVIAVAQDLVPVDVLEEEALLEVLEVESRRLVTREEALEHLDGGGGEDGRPLDVGKLYAAVDVGG